LAIDGEDLGDGWRVTDAVKGCEAWCHPARCNLDIGLKEHADYICCDFVLDNGLVVLANDLDCIFLQRCNESWLCMQKGVRSALFMCDLAGHVTINNLVQCFGMQASKAIRLGGRTCQRISGIKEVVSVVGCDLKP
jgi:hypothetical protein